MKKAILVIDYTNDFIADNGTLTVGKIGQALWPDIKRVLDEAYQLGEEIYIISDLHYENDISHPENKLFPKHNLAGSYGQQLYAPLQKWVEVHQGIQQLTKTRYSAFFQTDLAIELRNKKIDTVKLIGVCTDICILHTAIEAYNLDFNIEIDETTVASFDKQAHDFALQHMQKNLGANIIRR